MYIKIEISRVNEGTISEDSALVVSIVMKAVMINHKVLLKFMHSLDNTDNQLAVDGGWGRWSSWSTCKQEGSTDPCHCRHRSCDSPAPARGGANCLGASTEVSLQFDYI